MFSNVIKQIEVSLIKVDRSDRQRTELTFDSILPLAVSIGRSQWISPILIDEETHYIIAGERRLTAVKALRAAVEGDYSGFSNPNSAREELFPVCTCQIDSWKNWTKIPAQLGKGLTQTDTMMYEFIENAQRQDLTWQDRARAIYNLHTLCLRASADSDEIWTIAHTARTLNVHKTTVTKNLQVWRVYADETASEDIKRLILDSSTLQSAAQNIDRFVSRREEGLGVVLLPANHAEPKPKSQSTIYIKPGPAPSVDVNKAKIESISDWIEDESSGETISDKILINADFNEWAGSYEGEPFNFLHCDFPYGININEGNRSVSSRTAQLGHYDDSPEVYWQLLNTLKTHQEKLIAPQAHIMFWFSQNFRRETEDFFLQMGGNVQAFLMIWNTGLGITPDPQRYGARTYETAMCISFGDRKVVGPKDLSFTYSRGVNQRIHRSQKPTQVLEHFFEMFVDGSSRMLDPTAGSGSSLISALSRSAKTVFGLEKDPEIYANACKYIDAMGKGVKI